MIKKILSTLLVVTNFYFVTIAQKNSFELKNVQKTPSGHIRCLTIENDQEIRQNNQSRGSLEEFEQWLAPQIEAYKNNPNKTSAIITIPVVIHIIHNGDAIGTGENITDAQALSQIQVLNQDFRRMLGTPGYNTSTVGADCEIEFCMAQTDPSGNPTNGINRVNTGVASYTSMGTIDGTLKPATIWDPTKYMNMWTVRFSGGMAGTLGYAQFPDNSGLAGLNASGGAATSDGLVMSFDAFGTNALNDGTFILNPTYNLGRTATHEIGHWLGLRHIWGDGSTCGTSDFCNDTPMSDAANFGCPNTNSCVDPGTNPRDMVENYMDYTDDACMNIFTLDQKARISTVMAICPRRMELATSDRCSAPTSKIKFVTTSTTLTEKTTCGYTDLSIELAITKAPTANATVTVSATGTATLGTDFSILNNPLVFNSGSTTSNFITVRVMKDSEVETNETIILSFSVSTSGDALATTDGFKNHTVNINDDDVAPAASVNITVVDEKFETGLGTFTTTGNATTKFLTGNATAVSSTNWTVQNTNATNFAYSNDDACNCNKANDRLISPVFSLSGYSSATLTFDHAFSKLSTETGTVLISTDGGTTYSATPLVTLTNTSTSLGGGKYSTPWVNNNSVNLNAYLGQTNLRIAFRYNDAGGWNYGMAIDNVKIVGLGGMQIQTAVNSIFKDSTLLGPNQTVHYYDPTTDKIMGSIQNTSSWNYGCTTMEVDRAGSSSVAFWNTTPSQYLASKTFLVNPTSNNITGSYNIDLYYTDTEITAWETATGKNRSALKIVKVSNSSVSTITSANFGGYSIEIIPATITAFGTGMKISSSFSTGFSGFGVGDPGGVLSTNITNFTAISYNQKQVMLNWNSSSTEEINNYEIEHSIDNITYSTIEKITLGHSPNHTFKYIHKNPTAGINYYRIKIYNNDESIIYSETKEVVMDFEKSEITIFPNPTSNNVNLYLHTESSQNIKVEVYSELSSELILSNNFISNNGFNEITLETGNLATGIYFIKIKSPTHTDIKKLIKY